MKKRIKNIWQKYSSLFFNKRKAVIVSFVNAAILTVGTYFMNNCSLLTRENLDLYAGLEYLFGSDETVNDSVLLLNIAYDKQIAKKKVNGITVGNTDVTDRKALIKLLRNLRGMPQDSSYRYIFLDVRFEAGDETVFDSELFKEIESTPRLVIANHNDIVLADEKLMSKAAYSDFLITLTSNNFVRYQYLREEGESMPLRAYRELYGDSIMRHGWLFYTCNNGLCQNTHVVKSVLKVDESTGESNSGSSVVTRPYYQNLNKINDIRNLSELAKNKYVVVGNMIDDKHDTFFGKIPGSILVFSAYWSLKNEENVVKPWIEVLFFLLFFCVSLSLFSREPVIEKISWIRASKSKTLHFIVTFLSYSTVILVATIILYLCFNVISSIWVPALYFSIQKAYFTYKYLKV